MAMLATTQERANELYNLYSMGYINASQFEEALNELMSPEKRRYIWGIDPVSDMAKSTVSIFDYKPSTVTLGGPTNFTFFNPDAKITTNITSTTNLTNIRVDYSAMKLKLQEEEEVLCNYLCFVKEIKFEQWRESVNAIELLGD